MASRPGKITMTLVYVVMLAAAVGLFLLIRTWGEGLTAPPAADASSHQKAVSPQSDVLLHVLLALAVVLAAGRLLGRALAYMGQPPVIGEVIAGILLGPSLLGWLWPDGARF